MPVWPTRPVTDQSRLTLRSWRVIQTPGGAQHLIRYCIENREGRVSSVVQEIDYETLIARTGTGRVYALQGGPGADADAKYVWRRWAALNAVEPWEDVTRSVDQGTEVRPRGALPRGEMLCANCEGGPGNADAWRGMRKKYCNEFPQPRKKCKPPRFPRESCRNQCKLRQLP